MTEIGEIYREFRTSKQISLKEASNGIISISFLSRFERGQYDISFKHLVELLDRINVQLSEFEYLYHKKNKDNNDLLPTFQRAFQSGDINTLENHLTIWSRQQGKFAELQVIQLKTMLTILGKPLVSEQDIAILQDYFNSITSWTFFEIYLYGHSLQFLNKEVAINLFKELSEKDVLYNNFRSDSFSIIFYVYNNLILFLLESKELDYARLLIHVLSSHFDDKERDYYHRARFYNLQGLEMYLRGEKAKGLQLLKKSNLITYLCNHTGGFFENEKKYLARFLDKEELQDIFDFSKPILVE